ncbi:MAG: site-specific DNA-methyltransferase [Candidatus Nitricoxidivorans perseverans]|uniref:Methyltransferase n=1 Tax=Candidatus Nitricoxidivorans perseverans TaxID=2975601 RepID=A0AA49FJW9_9PROT|nr:MAG: site-specific DNA-methyltransferase [Candidatus Nitricoxidivorans perseverans]
MALKTEIVQGDCVEELRHYPDDFFDLIVTSPPYADRRQHTYGGIKPEQYVDWFIGRSAEFLRVLKPTGSFVLNIKEKAENGERHTYVIELILALRQQGWLWTDEYIWHKRNCYPGKWPNRFRDAWERCLHFTKSRKFKMNQESVMVPMGDWADARLKSLGKNDVVRFDSQVGSGFGKNIANWAQRTMAYPTNVLHLATECGNKNHSAAFPRALPEWFIKLFTDEGDWVLDPFAGSGTTLEVAKSLGRNAVGIDILFEYCEMARETVLGNQYQLLEERARYAVTNQETNGRVHRKKHSKLPSEAPGKPRRAKA